MMVGERIRERLGAVGISQAELARRVKLSQPAINGLIRGATRSTTHLHKIARELDTTPAYLAGETDDPNPGALPPPRVPLAMVMLPVTLPSEDALAEMFEGLLDAIGRPLEQAELARELAQLLPTGLSQLRGLLPDAVSRQERRAAEPAVLASADRERTR